MLRVYPALVLEPRGSTENSTRIAQQAQRQCDQNSFA